MYATSSKMDGNVKNSKQFSEKYASLYQELDQVLDARMAEQTSENQQNISNNSDFHLKSPTLVPPETSPNTSRLCPNTPQVQTLPTPHPQAVTTLEDVRKTYNYQSVNAYIPQGTLIYPSYQYQYPNRSTIHYMPNVVPSSSQGLPISTNNVRYPTPYTHQPQRQKKLLPKVGKFTNYDSASHIPKIPCQTIVCQQPTLLMTSNNNKDISSNIKSQESLEPSGFTNITSVSSSTPIPQLLYRSQNSAKDMNEHNQHDPNLAKPSNINIEQGQNLAKASNINIEHGQNSAKDMNEHSQHYHDYPNLATALNINIEHGQNSAKDMNEHNQHDPNLAKALNINIEHGQNSAKDMNEHNQHDPNLATASNINVQDGQNLAKTSDINNEHRQNLPKTSDEHNQHEPNLGKALNINTEQGQHLAKASNINIEHGQNLATNMNNNCLNKQDSSNRKRHHGSCEVKTVSKYRKIRPKTNDKSSTNLPPDDNSNADVRDNNSNADVMITGTSACSVPKRNYYNQWATAKQKLDFIIKKFKYEPECPRKKNFVEKAKACLKQLELHLENKSGQTAAQSQVSQAPVDIIDCEKESDVILTDIKLGRVVPRTTVSEPIEIEDDDDNSDVECIEISRPVRLVQRSDTSLMLHVDTSIDIEQMKDENYAQSDGEEERCVRIEQVSIETGNNVQSDDDVEQNIMITEQVSIETDNNTSSPQISKVTDHISMETERSSSPQQSSKVSVDTENCPSLQKNTMGMMGTNQVNMDTASQDHNNLPQLDIQPHIVGEFNDNFDMPLIEKYGDVGITGNIYMEDVKPAIDMLLDGNSGDSTEGYEEDDTTSGYSLQPLPIQEKDFNNDSAGWKSLVISIRRLNHIESLCSKLYNSTYRRKHGTGKATRSQKFRVHNSSRLVVSPRKGDRGGYTIDGILTKNICHRGQGHYISHCRSSGRFRRRLGSHNLQDNMDDGISTEEASSSDQEYYTGFLRPRRRLVRGKARRSGHCPRGTTRDGFLDVARNKHKGHRNKEKHRRRSSESAQSGETAAPPESNQSVIIISTEETNPLKCVCGVTFRTNTLLKLHKKLGCRANNSLSGIFNRSKSNNNASSVLNIKKEPGTSITLDSRLNSILEGADIVESTSTEHEENVTNHHDTDIASENVTNDHITDTALDNIINMLSDDKSNLNLDAYL